MSDNYITLIPENPRFVPSQASQHCARDRFAEIAPNAEIEIVLNEQIEFFDCGQNLELIRCPRCHAKISGEWWQARMDEDYDKGFKLYGYPTACCGTKVTLDELDYDWPQGFGRFAIDAKNANIGRLEDRHKREFEAILGTKLRVIYQHI